MITFLSGGTGTLPLLLGMRTLLNDREIAVVVTTADAFAISGGHMLGSADAVMFLFAGILNTSTWNGILGDTYATHRYLQALGRPEPITVGDRERAVQIARADLLHSGMTLTGATEVLAGHLSLSATLLPAADVPVRALVKTDEGLIPFPLWQAADDREPQGIVLEHNGPLVATKRVLSCIRNSDAVIIGPSEPAGGILPILACSGVPEALADTFVIAVSPFSGTRDGSGPEGRLMRAEGLESSSQGVFSLYEDFCDLFVQDSRDVTEVDGALRIDTRLHSQARSESLAWDLMAVVRRVSGRRRGTEG
ncbi:MAG: YvcK family protein [Methanomicrobiaceae archaeon]|nr:YvcK family protein [Methanomicrobiaceae archaeon]